MTGRIVARPTGKHNCDPGVTWRQCPEHAPGTNVICPRDAPHLYAVLPTPWKYPKGTVWECECGLRYVSRGSLYLNEPGGCYWRPESFARLRRWHRRRKAARHATGGEVPA